MFQENFASGEPQKPIINKEGQPVRSVETVASELTEWRAKKGELMKLRAVPLSPEIGGQADEINLEWDQVVATLAALEEELTELKAKDTKYTVH